MSENKPQFTKFFRGIGSIIDIYPSPGYDEIIPNQSVEQRIENVWLRVRKAFEKTFEELDHCDKKPPTQHD